MDSTALGQLVVRKRKEKGLTQEELAGLGRLDIRTIQRVEKGEVIPYFSTLKKISRVLDCDLIVEANTKPWQFSDNEARKYREMFRKKRAARIGLFVGGLTSMLIVATTFPSFKLFGMPKSAWAPFYLLIMFGIIIAIGLVWRCPACRSQLGDPFKSRYCPHCGFKFIED
jgi:transcriptional regulator with XRE-family HTH domain